MTLFLFPCFRTSSPSPTVILSFKPISLSPKRKSISANLSARDKIIDFGKYKGKMLGTLPSKYLKWVSKNLRARDFEQWAKLADEVLEDPVYKDRLEWEFVEKFLNGDDSRVFRTETPVSDMVEIAERFGWDNEDKAGWNSVDFTLLGTSKGGRIPRIGVSEDGSLKKSLGVSKMGRWGDLGKGLRLRKERKLGFRRRESRVSEIGEMGCLEKDLGLESERKLGALDRDSEVSRIEIEEMGCFEKDLELERERKLGVLNRDSEVSRIEIEEMGCLGKDLESKRERKFGVLNRDSGISRIGAVSSMKTESRLKNGRNLGSLEEEYTFQREGKVEFLGEEDRTFEGRKVGFLSKGTRYYDINEEDFDEEKIEGRREERRERQRLKRSLQMQRLKREVGVKEDGLDRGGIQKQIQKGNFNPFPGRDALLRKW